MKWSAEPGHRGAAGRIRGDLLPAAVVLFFVALAFGPLLGRRALAGYDVTNYALPNRVQVARALLGGHLPLWDPFRFGGAPLLASPQAAVLYPLSWPLLPLPPDRGEEVIRVLHVAIAALGAYAFARGALETSAVSGFVAAIAFGLGGFVHAHIGHIEQTTALAWLPWALLATDRALAAPRFGEALRPLICLGFALALCGLAGHPQYLHMGIALVAAYAAMTARPWRRSLRVLFGVALGLALAAAQLLPAWSLSLHSMRAGGLSFSAAAANSLPWREAVTAFLPDYFGPVRLGPVEFWAWVPWSVLLLAGAALARDAPGRKAWALAILALLGWLLALGSGTPLFRIAYELLPGTSFFRVPARWLLVPSLALPLLSAAGLESILRAEPTSRRKALVLLAAAALAAAGAVLGAGRPRPASIAAGVLAGLLTWGLRRGAGRKAISGRLAAAAVAAIAAAELLGGNSHAYARTLRMEAGSLLRRSDAAQALGDPSGGRILSIGSEDAEDFPAQRRHLRPNTHVYDGLRSVDGYDGGLLIDPHWTRAMIDLTGRKDFLPDASLRGNLAPPYGGRLDPERFAELDITRAVVAATPLDIPALLPKGSHLLRRVGDVDLWATPSRGPVFLTGGEAPEGLRLLRDPEEPEKLEVLLPPAAGGKTVVVSEAYSPGWSASGGIPLKRHHDLLMAFDAPPGTRQVSLRYRAPGFLPGAALSAAALLAALVLALIASRTLAQAIPRPTPFM
jgi:hypothetical protein